MIRRCWCCSVSSGWTDRGPCAFAVASWAFASGNTRDLGQACLDDWLDNADDDPALEPTELHWLVTA